MERRDYERAVGVVSTKLLRFSERNDAVVPSGDDLYMRVQLPQGSFGRLIGLIFGVMHGGTAGAAGHLLVRLWWHMPIDDYQLARWRIDEAAGVGANSFSLTWDKAVYTGAGTCVLQFFPTHASPAGWTVAEVQAEFRTLWRDVVRLATDGVRDSYLSVQVLNNMGTDIGVNDMELMALVEATESGVV